jgi:hypothetical protein
MVSSGVVSGCKVAALRSRINLWRAVDAAWQRTQHTTACRKPKAGAASQRNTQSTRMGSRWCVVDGTHGAVGKDLRTKASSGLGIFILPKTDRVLCHCVSFHLGARGQLPVACSRWLAHHCSPPDKDRFRTMCSLAVLSDQKLTKEARILCVCTRSTQRHSVIPRQPHTACPVASF